MNTILVLVALLGSALCEDPTPQPPQPLPEVKKPEEVKIPGMMEGKIPGGRGLFGKKFDNLSEEEKAELEKKREEIKKEVREKMSKLIEQLNDALDKQSAILDDKSLSRKEKLKALRELREENPKAYNVLKAIFLQFVPKPKLGKGKGLKRMMGPFERFGSQEKKSRDGWQKEPKEKSFKKSFGPKMLPKLVKAMEGNAVPVKA